MKMQSVKYYLSAPPVTLFCLSIFLLTSCAQNKTTGGGTALLTYVEGQVEAKISPDASWEQVKAGDTVPEGSVLRTGQGYADVKFLDEGLIRLKANSVFRLVRLPQKTSDSKGELELSAGELLCKFEAMLTGATMEISTPTAIAGVRGTEFGVYGTQDTTQVGVLSGTVEVKSATVEAAPVIVGFQQKTLVYKGQPPKAAEQLLEEELNRLSEINLLHPQVYIQAAKTVTEYSEAKDFVKQIEMFKAYEGRYPADLQELATKQSLSKLPKDQWGSDFFYSVSEDGQQYTLISPGPDKALQTGDDVKFH